MHEEMLDVYGEDGIETGEVLSKTEIHERGLIHKTVQVWVIDEVGHILLQRRNPSKRLDPNMWATPGGHVDSGEESRVAASRELFEESGIEKDPSDFLYLGTVQWRHDVADDFIENELVDVYITVASVEPDELPINDEVIGNKYFSLFEIEKAYAENHPEFAYRPEAFSLIKEYLYGTQ